MKRYMHSLFASFEHDFVTLGLDVYTDLFDKVPQCQPHALAVFGFQSTAK